MHRRLNIQGISLIPLIILSLLTLFWINLATADIDTKNNVKKLSVLNGSRYYYFRGAPVFIHETKKSNDALTVSEPGIIRKPAAEQKSFTARFINPDTEKLLFVTDELIVKLFPGQKIEEIASQNSSAPLSVIRKLRGTENEFLLRVNNQQFSDVLETANSLVESQQVDWAEPNFFQYIVKSAIPEDSNFSSQWSLRNDGKNGGIAGADVKATDAWDIETGHPDVVIAVVDDGIDIFHEDLAANIFVNPNEIPDNNVDDDGNGYVDDVNGWDFFDNDNNANPSAKKDNHGTNVAGIAAAVGFNGVGISGVCPSCSILPVKINRDDSLVGNATLAEALRYAASFSAIINNSWELSGQSSVIQSAISDSYNNGRNGLGALLVFSSGNAKTAYTKERIFGIPSGTHRFILEYIKDAANGEGEDTVWLGGVKLPDGTFIDFEKGVPVGWSTGGDSPWTIINDPIHSLEERCLTYVAKAGNIIDSQSSTIEFISTVTKDFSFIDAYVWTSSEKFRDKFIIRVDYGNDGVINESSMGESGVEESLFNVSYPAAYPEAIAVGASSNFDCRSRYSRFGEELDFLAPSSGSIGTLIPGVLKIQTTDRSGDAGVNGNYTSTFGGTSAAAPVASGIAGLILSRAPELTAAQVRNVMRNSANKVGPDAYVANRNNRYGFGRLNARAALSSITKTRTNFNLTVHIPSKKYSGIVKSSLQGINCGGSCSATYERGTVVSLDVTTNDDSVFLGFTGDDDCKDSEITLFDNTICTANFAAPKGKESNPGGGVLSMSILFLPLLLLIFIFRIKNS